MNEVEKNAGTVRRGYEAFNAADMKTLAELFDENAVWHSPGQGPFAGDHQGREAVFAQFGRYVSETGGTFKATLQHVLRSDDDRLVGIHHNTAKRNGRQLDVYCCIVFEFKAGRVIDGREHFYDLYAGVRKRQVSRTILQVAIPADSSPAPDRRSPRNPLR
jgi:uncharacterized protein